MKLIRTILITTILLLATFTIAQADRSTGSLTLDGDGDYLLVPDNDAIDGSGFWSVTAWVRHDGTSPVCQTIVGKNWHNGYWFGICPGNKLRLTVDGDSFDADIDVPPNQWTHVAFSKNGGLFMTVNGVFAGARPDGFPSINDSDNSHPMGIGADYDGQLELSGEIAQLIYWNGNLQSEYVMRDWDGVPHSWMNNYWPLAANGQDVDGTLHATAHGGATFSAESPPIFPFDPIRIPELETAPTLDGACSEAEYGAVEIPMIYTDSTFIDSATIRVAATPTHLYICGTSLEVGDWTDHKFAAYIDSTNTGGFVYTPDHFRIWTEQPQLVSGEWEYELVAEQGNMNMWQPISADLSADVSGFLVAWTTEMRIARADLGGLDNTFTMLFAHFEEFDTSRFVMSWPLWCFCSYQSPSDWMPFIIGDAVPTAVGLTQQPNTSNHSRLLTSFVLVSVLAIATGAMHRNRNQSNKSV